jgi:hypothetical protein
MEFFVLLLGRVWKMFISACAWLMEHPKVFAAIVLALVLAFGYWKIQGLKHEISQMKEQVIELQDANKKLSTELDTCASVNANNQVVFEDMKAHATLTEQELSAMRTKNAATVVELGKLKASLAGKEDGPVAPVLKAAIDGIEQSRKERQQ